MFTRKSKPFLLGLAVLAAAAIEVAAAPPDDPPAHAFPAPKERFMLKGHDFTVWTAAFSSDGKTLATAAGLYNKPGQLIVWDVGTGQVKAKVDEPAGIRALAFSP